MLERALIFFFVKKKIESLCVFKKKVINLREFLQTIIVFEGRFCGLNS